MLVAVVRQQQHGTRCRVPGQLTRELTRCFVSQAKLKEMNDTRHTTIVQKRLTWCCGSSVSHCNSA